MPNRRDPDYITISFMIIVGGYVLYTGIIMDLYGSDQFVYHSLAGYLISGLVVLHLGLNFSKARSYIKSKWRSSNKSTAIKSASENKVVSGSPKSFARRGVILASVSGIAGFVAGRHFSRDNSACLDAEPTEIGFSRWFESVAYAAGNLKHKFVGKRDRYKIYPDASQTKLLKPVKSSPKVFMDLVRARRSFRDFSKKPLELAQVSTMLFAAQGETAKKRGYRSVPSSGALFPIELYVVANRIDGIKQGVHHYNLRDGALELLKAGDYSEEVMDAGIGQELLRNAACVIVISAVFFRTKRKYKKQTYRFILLEAGHVAQNLVLSATDLDLGSCTVGSINPKKMGKLIESVDDEKGLYLVAIGHK